MGRVSSTALAEGAQHCRRACLIRTAYSDAFRKSASGTCPSPSYRQHSQRGELSRTTRTDCHVRDLRRGQRHRGSVAVGSHQALT